MFAALEAKGIKPAPKVLPALMPGDVTVRNMWLDALSDPHAQGCGHVRLSMEKVGGLGLGVWGGRMVVGRGCAMAPRKAVGWLFPGLPSFPAL